MSKNRRKHIEPKITITEIPRWIIVNNNKYLDYTLVNSDEAFENFIENQTRETYLYFPRNEQDKKDLEQCRELHRINEPVIGRDRVVAQFLGESKTHPDNYLIKVIDSSYYSKLSSPVIKVNGMCVINEDKKEIFITRIQRLTLGDGQIEM
ncbi:MAG: hypothetical protein ACI4V7_08455 [Succinivibrionaceae bacterium]